jgi:hypothetical protein
MMGKVTFSAQRFEVGEIVHEVRSLRTGYDMVHLIAWHPASVA